MMYVDLTRLFEERDIVFQVCETESTRDGILTHTPISWDLADSLISHAYVSESSAVRNPTTR